MRQPFKLAAVLLLLFARPLAGEGGVPGVSLLPFFGYDDKNGWSLGAAGFYYLDGDPGFKLGLFGVSNFAYFNSATATFESRQGGWATSFVGVAERSFDYYYGEGNATPSADPLVVRLNHAAVDFSVLHSLTSALPQLRLGPYVDSRFGQQISSQLSVEGTPGPLVVPEENHFGLGLQAVWDTRDSLLEPSRGGYDSIILRTLPDSWAGKGAVSQADLDFRRFVTPLKNFTVASRLMGGFSMGEPSYLYRYRLGGTDWLRGYKDNRFRGKNYYLLQEEGRWALWPPYLSLNISADAGAFTDGGPAAPMASGQVGLRLGIPPDWGQKVRIDFGVSEDQQTVQVQFGEVF